jgi:hypothetical protein
LTPTLNAPPTADRSPGAPPPTAVFVGAEYEDNLSIRTLVAAVRRAGLTASFLRFNSAAERDDVVARLASASPPFVGLSLAFQHRAAEFLELAAALADTWRR